MSEVVEVPVVWLQGGGCAGVCPTGHGTASALCLDDALGVAVAAEVF